MKSERWSILLNIDEYFEINEFIKSKEKIMTKFCVIKQDEWFAISSKSKNWIIRKRSF
jgi:hypothetical protein